VSRYQEELWPAEHAAQIGGMPGMQLGKLKEKRKLWDTYVDCEDYIKSGVRGGLDSCGSEQDTVAEFFLIPQ
jgi:hypothetical protein